MCQALPVPVAGPCRMQGLPGAHSKIWESWQEHGSCFDVEHLSSSKGKWPSGNNSGKLHGRALSDLQGKEGF